MKIAALLSLLATASMASVESPAPSAIDTYRDFLIAMVKGDQAAADKLALPNPDLALIFTGETPPAEIQKRVIAQITASPYHVLQTGEVFHLPSGKTVSPTEEMERKGESWWRTRRIRFLTCCKMSMAPGKWTPAI